MNMVEARRNVRRDCFHGGEHSALKYSGRLDRLSVHQTRDTRFDR